MNKLLVILLFPLCTSALMPLLSEADGDKNSPPLVQPGDHIAVVGNSFADMMRQQGYFETLLLQNHPDLSLRNLGWAGDTLSIRQRPTNFPTEDETLTAHQTDLILICFGMGESFDGEPGLPAFKSDLETLLKHYQSQKYNGESSPRLVLVSPIGYENLGEITPGTEQRNADIAAYSAAMKVIAEQNDTHFIDLLTPTLALMNQEGGPHLTTNGIRLNDYGYWIAGHLLADAITPDTQPWLISIDAANNDANTTKPIHIKDIETTGGGLQFKIEESTWAPPPPPSPTTHKNLPFQRSQLSVHNLKPAYYTLTVDGEPVATATHEEWAQGVPIDTSPAHQEAGQFRNAVNDKNNQFFYSWRALNQVHIVGERRTSPSGQSLPGEVIQFNELADKRDEALRNTTPPSKTREWKLIASPERKLP